MIIIPAQQVNMLSSQINQLPPCRYVLDYIIEYECLLGKGNFSEVYRCYKISEPYNHLAVKLISVNYLKQKNLEQLIQAEINMLKSVAHQNVIACYDFYYDKNWCYIFSEYFPEGNLQGVLKKSNKIKQESILCLIKDIFEGLLYLQKSNIIHRDVKPANIFIKAGRAVIADLGFSKFFKQPFYDLQIGSPPYMPPQALTKGYYNNKTDVWAFGVMLYQIFHGEGPYQKCFNMRDLVEKVLKPISIVNLRSDLSIEIKQLILSCLEIDLFKRPRFSQITQSWYFRKLFYKIPSDQVTKRNNQKQYQHNKQNYFFLSEKKSQNQSRSSAFNRINRLKSEIKRTKQENLTPSSCKLSGIKNSQGEGIFKSNNNRSNFNTLQVISIQQFCQKDMVSDAKYKQQKLQLNSLSQLIDNTPWIAYK